MRVIKAFPPNYPAIRRAFPSVKGVDALFAYGDVIYYPSGRELTPALRAHEAVHGVRQGSDPKGWWDRYIADPKFRLEEEILAHRAEYQSLQASGAKWSELKFVIKRLCSPLYGAGITFDEAASLIGR